MRRFVAVDLETTGVDYKQDYICEVGLAGEKHDGSYFETAFSLDIPDGSMSEGAAKVNGWGQRQFAPIVTQMWAVGFLNEVLDDVHIVGKNPHFDESFLQEFFRDYGKKDYPMQYPWHHRLVDVGCLAWSHLKLTNLKGETAPVWLYPPNVEQVERAMNIPRETVDGFHTALTDARWAYKVFRHLLPKGDERK